MRKHYDDVVRPKLIEEFGYKNAMEVPTIEKIVLNMGVGDAVNDTKKVTLAAADLALIAGQKPVITRARKAISTFKVRENMPIGAKVTLRKTRMYEFLDRLVTIALPRVRDFRGLNPKSFDGRGNFALGIKEHLMFPEINYDKVEYRAGHGHHRLHHGQDRRRSPRSPARLQLPVPAVSREVSDAETRGNSWLRKARSRRTSSAPSWRPTMRRQARASPGDRQRSSP